METTRVAVDFAQIPQVIRFASAVADFSGEVESESAYVGMKPELSLLRIEG